MTITGITPSKGTPYGGQSVTITGTGFGTTSGTVTVDGRSATVATWSDTSITIDTPARVTDGVYSFAGGSVAVVVSDGVSSASTTYEYAATIWERALQSVRNRIASGRVQDGYFFDYSTSQVAAIKKDQTADTGAAWPQVIVYPLVNTFSQDVFEQGFYVSSFDFIVQAVVPLGSGGLEQWSNQCAHIASDMHRAIMRDMGNDGTSNTVQIKNWEPGVLTDAAEGSLTVVSLECSTEIRVILQDPTTQTVTPSY